MNKRLKEIRQLIINDPQNKTYTDSDFFPVYDLNENSKIIIIGQAPGVKAQNSGITWDDKSGDNLRSWLGVSKEEFYNVDLFALMPMDFYYPGKGKSGDLPPRKGFAEKWHPKLLEELKNLKLVILIGNYALKYYLKDKYNKNLTETVRNYELYLPKYFTLVHPSPLNFRWQNNNKWFLKEVIPKLKEEVRKIIDG